jgi:hypothetical protein
MRIFRPILGVVVAVALSGAATAKPFTYVNERFGTSATFPDEIFVDQQEPPANGDGLRWLAKDGASVAIYGAYNVLDDTPKTLVESGSALPGRTVTYAKTGRNWAVLSGFEDGAIFYERRVISPTGIVHGVEITYPKELKAKYDPLAGKIAASLRGP